MSSKIQKIMAKSEKRAAKKKRRPHAQSGRSVFLIQKVTRERAKKKFS